MTTRPTDPNGLHRPTDRTVHDILIAWFTTPRLQDELLTRDRDAVKHVLDLLRRRLRTERPPSEDRTRKNSKAQRGRL